MSSNQQINTTNTPNIVVKNPDIRMGLSIFLFGLSVLAAVAALFFLWFPEATYGSDIPTRAIGFTNALVSLLSGIFGLSVLVPNIPRRI